MPLSAAMLLIPLTILNPSWSRLLSIGSAFGLALVSGFVLLAVVIARAANIVGSGWPGRSATQYDRRMSNEPSAPDSSVNPDPHALAKAVASTISADTATTISPIDGVTHKGWEIALLRWNEVSGGTYDFWDRTNLWLTTEGLIVRWSVGWYGDSDERFESVKFAEPNDILVLDQLWRDEVVPWEGPSGGTNHFRGHNGPPFRPNYEAMREALESLRARHIDSPS